MRVDDEWIAGMGITPAHICWRIKRNGAANRRVMQCVSYEQRQLAAGRTTEENKVLRIEI